MYDLIGDIHGFGTALEDLLKKMDYQKTNGVYKHSERKLVFLGDYIDRGSEHKKVLKIVRSMVDEGHAIALMGNHEYNALCFNTKKADGTFLRPHSSKNIGQHKAMLDEFSNDMANYQDYINWFYSLPLFMEQDQFRAIHATWHQDSIEELNAVLINHCLSPELMHKAEEKGSSFNDAIEISLKGLEQKLPGKLSFKDKDKNERFAVRVKWWMDPNGKNLSDICLPPNPSLADLPADPTYKSYQEGEKPVFFGHYWMTGKPHILSANACCLDYSIAKNGVLTAYRFQEDGILSNDHLVFV